MGIPACPELLSRIGLIGKGRFYSGSTGKFPVEFDNYLRDRGFTLYEIGLWRGPNHYGEEIRKAFAERAGLDETPATDEIRSDYRRTWTDFRPEKSAPSSRKRY